MNQAFRGYHIESQKIKSEYAGVVLETANCLKLMEKHPGNKEFLQRYIMRRRRRDWLKGEIEYINSQIEKERE